MANKKRPGTIPTLAAKVLNDKVKPTVYQSKELAGRVLLRQQRAG